MSDLPYAALGVSQAVSFFMSIAPNPVAVNNQTTNNPAFAHDLHTAEVIAGGLAVTIGTVQAVHSKSFVPLIYSGCAVVGMVALYEYLLRRNANV